MASPLGKSEERSWRTFRLQAPHHALPPASHICNVASYRVSGNGRARKFVSKIQGCLLRDLNADRFGPHSMTAPLGSKYSFFFFFHGYMRIHYHGTHMFPIHNNNTRWRTVAEALECLCTAKRLCGFNKSPWVNLLGFLFLPNMNQRI